MIILCLLPVSAVLLTLYRLETYESVVHNDSSFYVCCYSIIAFIISTIIYLRIMKENRFSHGIWILSTVVLAFVYYVGSKIPFCVVCDQVTADDLGFLIYWITPEVPPQ